MYREWGSHCVQKMEFRVVVAICWRVKLCLIEFLTIGASSEKILIWHLFFRHYFLLLHLVVNLSWKKKHRYVYLSYRVVDLYFRPFWYAPLCLQPSIFLIFVKLFFLSHWILLWAKKDDHLRSSLVQLPLNVCFSLSRTPLWARGTGVRYKVSSIRCMRQFNVWNFGNQSSNR